MTAAQRETLATKYELLNHPAFWEELSRIQLAQSGMMLEVSDALARNNENDLQDSLYALLSFTQQNTAKLAQFTEAFEEFTSRVLG